VKYVVTWGRGDLFRLFNPEDLAAALDFAVLKRREFRGRRRVLIGGVA
jgi:hypothetical protein